MYHFPPSTVGVLLLNIEVYVDCTHVDVQPVVLGVKRYKKKCKERMGKNEQFFLSIKKKRLGTPSGATLFDRNLY